MNHILADTLQFIQENFDAETSWTVPPSQSHLKQRKPRVEKKIELPTQQAPVFEKKHFTPPQEEIELPDLSIPTIIREKIPPKPTLIEPAPLGVDSLSQAVKDLFPQFSTRKEPPKTHIDPSYKKVLQAHVILFSFREGKETDLFLKNIAIAIGAQLSSAAVFDAKKWEQSQGSFDSFFKQAQAKMFIASETLYQKSSLLPFLKEHPVSSEKLLGEGKLLTLLPFDQYFASPSEKKELWKILCTTLKKNTSASS